MYVSYCNKCFITHIMIALGRSRRYNGTFKGHVSFISKKCIHDINDIVVLCMESFHYTYTVNQWLTSCCVWHPKILKWQKPMLMNDCRLTFEARCLTLTGMMDQFTHWENHKWKQDLCVLWMYLVMGIARCPTCNTLNL